LYGEREPSRHRDKEQECDDAEDHAPADNRLADRGLVFAAMRAVDRRVAARGRLKSPPALVTGRAGTVEAEKKLEREHTAQKHDENPRVACPAARDEDRCQPAAEKDGGDQVCEVELV
jgi:hypothetical protein